MTTPTATLEYLAPGDLLTDRNIREDLALDREFLASVREHGVIVPIVAVRTDEGIRVRHGHRRTAAAHTEGIDTVPVVVLDAEPTDDEADRIVTQLTENHHRAELTSADTLNAVQQLALLGCSETTIARRTKIKKKTVQHALAAADSELGRTAAAALPALTLEHLAWLAEFEDEPEVTDRLIEAFINRPETARHTIERARENREARQALEAAYARMAEAHPSAARYDGPTYDDPNAAYLNTLADADGQPLDGEAHEHCPGDAYHLTPQRWVSADDDAQDNTPGLLTVNGIVFRVNWLCTDWRANGHKDRYLLNTSDDNSSEPGERAEQAKAQRRRTITLNRAGDAAQTVRREWLTAFTARKTAPKDAAAFMLAGLAKHHPAASEDAPRGLAAVADLLAESDLSAWANTQTPARISHIMLCARLWAYEQRTDKSIWRDGTRYGDYLRALASWGYPLSEAEQVATGELTEEQAVDLLTPEQP